MTQEFSEAQLAELRAIITEFRVMSEPLEPPEDFESQEELESADNDIGGTERFNPDNVDYFDSFYESKFIDTIFAIEHINKSTFFRDIHVFVDRVKNVIRVKSDTLLRQNLQICLRDFALIWFITELIENDKRLITYSIDEWYRLLLTRWKQPRAQDMIVLLREKYSMQDTIRHREPREYAQIIMRATQNTDMGIIKDHMLLIWNGLNFEFQRDISEPKAVTNYNRFLKSLNKRKYQ